MKCSLCHISFTIEYIPQSNPSIPCCRCPRSPQQPRVRAPRAARPGEPRGGRHPRRGQLPAPALAQRLPHRARRGRGRHLLGRLELGSIINDRLGTKLLSSQICCSLYPASHPSGPPTASHPSHIEIHEPPAVFQAWMNLLPPQFHPYDVDTYEVGQSQSLPLTCL